jgi:hypothetical protein
VLYRAHLAAGVGLGVVLAAGARAAGTLHAPQDLACLVGVTTVFALLPDLDTASVVQRWFYRVLLFVLLWMLGTGHVEHAAFVGTVAVLPLVHRHRGWMHAWWAALAVPLAALLLWDGYWIALGPQGVGLRDTLAGLGREVMARFDGSPGPRAVFGVAMVAGYGLHLGVDFWLPAWLRWTRIV